MASTITLQSVANFCSTHSDLLPLTGVGGYTSEPFLTIANDAMAEIINDAQDWKWNSVELFDAIKTFQPLVTSLNKQDYLFAGASAFVLQVSGTTQVTSSGAAIDLASNNAVTVSGGVVTVKTLEPHRFAVGNIVNLTGLVFPNTGTDANYNSVLTDNGSTSTWSTGYTITAVTSTSFSFAAGTGQNNGDVGGAPGITNWGWMTGVTMMELNNNSSPPNWRQMKAVRNLSKWSRVSDPERVSMEQDYGTGVLKFRFNQIPGGVIWAVGFEYQMSSPVLSTIQSATFSPIPDSFRAVVLAAVMYRMYKYLNPNSTATIEAKKNFKELLQTNKGSDNAEESNVYLQPTSGLVDDYWPSYGGTY